MRLVCRGGRKRSVGLALGGLLKERGGGGEGPGVWGGGAWWELGRVIVMPGWEVSNQQEGFWRWETWVGGGAGRRGTKERNSNLDVGRGGGGGWGSGGVVGGSVS